MSISTVERTVLKDLIKEIMTNDKQLLKSAIKEVLFEEKERIVQSDDERRKKIDNLLTNIFDEYDEVFKALA